MGRDRTVKPIAAQAFDEMLAAPMEVTGEKAVGRAEADIRSAEIAPLLDPSSAEVVRLVGSRTFSLVDGIWMDTSYDPDAMTTLRVPFLSADYFTLANSRSELGDAFALGQNVIIVVEGVAYEVVGADDQGDRIAFPEAEVEEEDDASGSEESSSPEVSDPSNRENGFSIPCLGSSFLSVLPLLFVFTRRNICQV